MRILIAFENPILPTLGGTERATHNLIAVFEQMGHRVVTLARYRKGGDHQHDVRYLPDAELQTGRNRQFVEQLVKSEDIDLLINEGGNNADALFFSHNSLDVNCKIITHLHFSVYQGYKTMFPQDKIVHNRHDFVKFLASPILRRRTREAIRRNYIAALQGSDAYVVLSESYKNAIVRFTHLKEFEGRVFATPNILSFPECPSDVVKEKRVLYVGRMSYSKRVDRLLKIWKIVENNVDDWHLDILGEGPARSYYEAMSKDLKLNRVTFHGRQNPLDFYRRAAILTLVSTDEGYPMTLIEGMSQGCVPVLFDSFPTASEVITDMCDGVLIKPFSKRGFANAMIRLMHECEMCESMAKNAIESSTRFKAEVIAENWQNIFNFLNL